MRSAGTDGLRPTGEVGCAGSYRCETLHYPMTIDPLHNRPLVVPAVPPVMGL